MKIVLAVFRLVYILEIVDGGWLMVERAAGRGGWPRVAGRDGRAPMGARCSLTYCSEAHLRREARGVKPRARDGRAPAVQMQNDE